MFILYIAYIQCVQCTYRVGQIKRGHTTASVDLTNAYNELLLANGYHVVIIVFSGETKNANHLLWSEM